MKFAMMETVLIIKDAKLTALVLWMTIYVVQARHRTHQPARVDWVYLKNNQEIVHLAIHHVQHALDLRNLNALRVKIN